MFKNGQIKSGPVKLDEIDFNILDILQKDSRKSYREIEEELGISIGTVFNRIHKLLDNKIIEGFTIKINYANMGYNLIALIRIDFDGKKISQLLQELSEKYEVCSIFRITGSDSLELICRFKDVDDIDKLINELSGKEGIFKINSNIVLKEYKNTQLIEIPNLISEVEIVND